MKREAKKKFSKISAFIIVFALALNSLLPVLANFKADVVNISIPEYDNVNWSNGAIKNVTINVDFKDNITENKKVEITLPDGMKFLTIPVQNSYIADAGVDTSILNRLGNSDPLSNAIISTTIPPKENVYDRSTFGKVVYNLSAGTERVSFTFSVRVDATKYYGETDLKNPIKAEAFMDGTSKGVSIKNIHVNGKVVGYANQDSVQTMFRNWYTSWNLNETIASTDSEDSYNYTKSYSVVSALNNMDDRGSANYLAKNVKATLYYPKEMEFVGIVDYRKNPIGENIINITNFPGEGKVTLEYQPMYNRGVGGFSVKYKIPVGTPNGTYTCDKIPSATIETYDGEIFQSDALVHSSTNQSKVSPDFAKIVDKGPNQMQIAGSNQSRLNPNDYSWAGSIKTTNLVTAGTKDNQMYQLSLDPNWEAKRIQLPFDKSISGNKITEIEYKTNLNPNFRSYNGELAQNLYQAVLDAKGVGLADNEYFTEIKANLGSFSSGYVNYDTGGDLRSNSTVSYGKIKDGINSVTFNASIWDKNNEASTKVSASSTYSVSNNISSGANGAIYFYDKSGVRISNILAGETVNATGLLRLYDYPYGTRTIIENPEIYLREIEGLNINPSSITLQNTYDNSEILFDIQETTDLKGEKVYILKTKNVKVGSSTIGYPIQTHAIKISYDFSSEITLQNDMNIDIQNMIAWGGPNITSAIGSNSFNDQGIDIDGDSIENENLLGVGNTILSIAKIDTVIVETFLSVSGEEPKGEYVEGDINTISYFTPGTDADYTVKITNNSVNPAPKYTMYIPIPKTGENFGKSFQDEAFKWNMKLGGPVNLIGMADLFSVTYSSNATESNFNIDASYVETPANYETVNMVKITNKKPISANAKIEFKIPLKVDETFSSATSENKIGSKNIYNPRYEVETPSFVGMLSGTKVGTELVIAEIGGTIFNDLNSNGIYDSGDTPIPYHEVLLYKYNDTTKTYEPVMSGGNQIKVSSDTNGIYLFDYTQGLGYGKYGVKFTEKTADKFEYTAYQIGSDKNIDSDAIVSGVDKGMALNIDATRAEAKTIGAGYLKYDPPIDLKVNIDTKEVEVGKNIKVEIAKIEEAIGETAEDTIQPNFFDVIKDNTQGYVWTIGDNSLATVTTNADGSATITGISTGSNSPSLAHTTITLTIKDIYGTVKSSTAPLIIKNADSSASNNGLIVGANNVVIENTQAKNQTLNTLKNSSKVVLLQKIVSGIDTNINDVTNLITLPTSQLNEIKNAGLTGGIYPLTLKTADDSIEITIKVIVKPDNAIENNDLSISALDYSLNNKDAKKETIDLAKQHSQAKGFLLNNGIYIDEISDISVNQEELNAIINVDLAGGVYPLTFTVTNIKTGLSISKTIRVTIGSDFKPEINGVTNKTIFIGDTINLMEGVTATDFEDGPITNKITIKGTVDENKPGNYTITYEVTDSDNNTTKSTAIITVIEPYKIKFNSNTGTGTMASQEGKTGEDIKLSNNLFVKDGYKFTGWNTEPDGTGTAYVDGASYTMGTSDVNLYAQWEAIDYTVTVNPTTNGTANVDKDVANVGDVVNVTTTPNAGYEVDTITVNGTVITGNSFTMPAEDVVVEVTFKAIDYTVTVNTDANGTANVDKDVANIGDVVNVTTTPNAGYEVDTITVNGTVITGNSFTMPAEDVVVEVTFKAIDYDVKVDTNIVNGNISIDKTSANVGDIITLTINADAGYQLKAGTLKVITASGVEIPLTQIARMTNGTFTFEMPAEDVTVFAEFELIPVVTPPVVEPEKPQPPTEETKPEVKPETGKNPITGTTGLVGILGAMGLAGAATLFTRKRKNK